MVKMHRFAVETKVWQTYVRLPGLGAPWILEDAVSMRK